MDKKRTIIEFFDRESSTRSKRRRRFGYFYSLTENYLRFYVPEGSSVLLIGCGTGELLHALKPSRGVGIDISGGMIEEARKNFPEYDFRVQDVEALDMDETFDVVIFSDVIGYLDDIQATFQRMRSVCNERTRVMITYFSIFWQFPLQLAERLGLKMKSPYFAWLEPDDIANLLDLSGFDIIRKNLKVLFPIYIPLLSFFFNFFLANLPLIRRLCLLEIVSARPKPGGVREERSVAVLIPTRNEQGNIAAALDRLPKLGSHTEVIFVDGHSTDGTLNEVERQAAARPDMDIRWYSQDGKGKGDAVL